MRLDRLLWFLRLTKTRPLAQALVEAGHIRLNGRRICHSSQAVAVGDVLVVPLPVGVKVLEIRALPARRGPAPEARACYHLLDGAPEIPIAAEAMPSPAPRRPEPLGSNAP